MAVVPGRAPVNLGRVLRLTAHLPPVSSHAHHDGYQTEEEQDRYRRRYDDSLWNNVFVIWPYDYHYIEVNRPFCQATLSSIIKFHSTVSYTFAHDTPVPCMNTRNWIRIDWLAIYKDDAGDGMFCVPCIHDMGVA